MTFMNVAKALMLAATCASIAFSPDGRRIAAASRLTLKVWNPPEGE